MKTRDILFAALAGLILTVFWYGQFALGLSGKSDAMFAYYIYPLIPAICLFILIRNERLKYALIKAGGMLGVTILLILAAELLNLRGALLGVFTPGSGMTPWIRGFIAQSSLVYFIINGVGVAVSLIYG